MTWILKQQKIFKKQGMINKNVKTYIDYVKNSDYPNKEKLIKVYKKFKNHINSSHI